eukprot:g47470.t1
MQTGATCFCGRIRKIFFETSSEQEMDPVSIADLTLRTNKLVINHRNCGFLRVETASTQTGPFKDAFDAASASLFRSAAVD